jgi:hypothetical protein
MGDKSISFYRPIDQHPPFAQKDDIENLLKCLDIDSILEVFSAILLEKKILFISKHKALLSQVMSCFMSFIFPFQWKHTLIPILPITMIDIIDAPFPFIIGIEQNVELTNFDIDTEIIKVDLDISLVTIPIDDLL